MKFASEAIGIRLIETVTSGLYDGNLNCLREYVQNGIDAGAKNIEISFENGDQNLIIQDDGSGMNKFELENKALGIGVSDKTEEDAGWRGIGIWSGVPICQRIVIITKKCDDKKFRIQINNDALRNEYMSNRPVLDILSNATGEIEELPLGNDESFENDHYTIVRLESILYNQKNIFIKDDIRSYLSSVVPAPFDAKQFELSTEINKWLNEKGVKYPSVNINFYGRIFRPPYKSDIFFKGFIQKEFIVDDKLIAVGWFLTTNKNEKLDKPNGGIYFKKKGFTLGDENLVLRQYSGTYHPWQYGEIHIISKELRENAARNNFEYNNRIVQTFLANVEEYIRQLEIQNHYQSDRIAANQIKKAQKYLENEDLQSAEKLADKIKKRLNKSARFPVEPSLKIMQPLIDSKFEQDKKEFSILETKINEIKSTTKGRKKDFLLNTVVNNLSIPVKDNITKLSSKGRLYPEISITEAVKEILEKKTGLKFTKNEIFELSKAAYGWTDVVGNNTPILRIDKTKDQRNRRFGVMVYTVYDLFVNLCKHEKGNDSFNWFENAPEEEREILVAEMYAVIDLIYRLIDKSEKNQP